MTLGEKIINRKSALGMTSEELAADAGVPLGTLNKILNGETKNPTGRTLKKLAAVLGCSVEYLYGDDRIMTPEFDYSRYPDLIPISQLKLRRVPVIGEIAAGVPITANREYDEYIEVPDTADARKYDLSLRVKGDSMKPRYLDGDLVFIRCQPDVRDGQIAAVVVGGEATLKRVYHVPGGVQLISENPEYSPMLYTEDDVNDIHLIGLAVGFMRWETQR